MPLGFHHSEETIQKMREVKQGSKHPLFGKHLSEEHKQKISKANIGKNIGRKYSPESIQKMREAALGNHRRLGKTTSTETKQKLRMIHLGKKLTSETKQKMSLAHLGKKFTQEHKKNMGKARQGNKSSSWKGEMVGYAALHNWMRKNKPKLNSCEHCGSMDKKLELAYEDHQAGKQTPRKYKRDINLFHWLCHSCHTILDGRMENMRKKKCIKS